MSFFVLWVAKKKRVRNTQTNVFFTYRNISGILWLFGTFRGHFSRFTVRFSDAVSGSVQGACYGNNKNEYLLH